MVRLRKLCSWSVGGWAGGPAWRRFVLGAALCGAAGASCRHDAPVAREVLRQRAYLWQRDWTPAVADALAEIGSRMDGVVVLGTEILWNAEGPEARAASVDWAALRRAKGSRAVALRIAPWVGPFALNDAKADFIAGVAHSLADKAEAAGVQLDEFQIDFDCGQKNLAGYRLWLRRLLAVVKPPTRLVMTTLPAWLEEKEFRSLVGEVDGYVLQVHSVPTMRESGREALFEPALARKWVAQAAKLGRPFSVSLPTYRCVAGYDGAGKLLGVYMDSVPPKWPAGTTTLEFSADADVIADIVREWQTARPREMQELIWYRAPVASDVRNWRWPTLAAVMAGRRPRRELQVAQDGTNPVDLSFVNAGEAEQPLASIVTATWRGGMLEAADALEGWSVVAEKERARFIPSLPSRARLAPGARRSIGWLRFREPTTIEIGVEK